MVTGAHPHFPRFTLPRLERCATAMCEDRAAPAVPLALRRPLLPLRDPQWPCASSRRSACCTSCRMWMQCARSSTRSASTVKRRRRSLEISSNCAATYVRGLSGGRADWTGIDRGSASVEPCLKQLFVAKSCRCTLRRSPRPWTPTSAACRPPHHRQGAASPADAAWPARDHGRVRTREGEQSHN